MIRIVLLVSALLVLAGCVSLPSNTDRNYFSSKVGDRASYDFKEMVIMVPAEKAQDGFLNLHIQLSAIINPRKVTFAGDHEVQDIIWRQYPRLATRVTETVLSNHFPLSDLNILRESVTQEANRVFDTEFHKWASAGDYEVQLVVISMHFTDGSVACKSESAWRYY